MEQNAVGHLRLAIVCPMANERDTAVRLAQEVVAAVERCGETQLFLIFDRASTDGTRELMLEAARHEPRIAVLWAAESRCVVDAYVHGYRAALAGNFDWILEMDAGFSHQPGEIARFIDRAQSDEWDCIFGSRFCAGGAIRKSSLKRRALSWAGTQLSNVLLGTRLRDMTSGFQMFRRAALAGILSTPLQSRGHFFQTEIKYRCRKLRVCEVPITYRAASPSVRFSSIVDALTVLFHLWNQRFTRLRNAR